MLHLFDHLGLKSKALLAFARKMLVPYSGIPSQQTALCCLDALVNMAHRTPMIVILTRYYNIESIIIENRILSLILILEHFPVKGDTSKSDFND